MLFYISIVSLITVITVNSELNLLQLMNIQSDLFYFLPGSFLWKSTRVTESILFGKLASLFFSKREGEALLTYLREINKKYGPIAAFKIGGIFLLLSDYNHILANVIGYMY